MAKGKGQINGWITKNGVHIPIYGHYSVRGGEEPKAKGARFKGGTRLHKRWKDEGIEGEKHYYSMNTDNGTAYVSDFDNDGDFGYNVRIDTEGGPEGGIRKTFRGKDAKEKAMEFAEKHLDDKTERVTGKKKVEAGQEKGKQPKRGMTDKELDTANRELDAKDAEADMEKYEAEHPMKKGKKERNVLGQEVDFAEVDRTAKEREKDFIVNTPIPEGKAWERAESKRKAMEAADEADAYDRQHKEGKYTNFQEQVNDRFKTKREWDEIAKNAGYKDSSDPEFQKNADDIVAKNKQESSTPTEPYAKSNNKYLGQSVKDLNKLDVRNLNDSELSQLREHASASSRTGARGADKLWKNVDTEINRRAMEKENSTPTIHETRLQRQAVNEKAGLKSDRNQNFKTAYQNGGSSTSTHTEKQDSLSASMNERSRIRGELHAKDKAMKAAMPTTVSGLRSAYADATGSMKSKIAAELRRKGYSLVGGKWVKGRKE